MILHNIIGNYKSLIKIMLILLLRQKLLLNIF